MEAVIQTRLLDLEVELEELEEVEHRLLDQDV